MGDRREERALTLDYRRKRCGVYPEGNKERRGEKNSLPLRSVASVKSRKLAGSLGQELAGRL